MIPILSKLTLTQAIVGEACDSGVALLATTGFSTRLSTVQPLGLDSRRIGVALSAARSPSSEVSGQYYTSTVEEKTCEMAQHSAVIHCPGDIALAFAV